MGRQGTRGLKTPPQYFPRYDGRELQTILRFLASVQKGLIAGIDGLIEFYGTGPLKERERRHIDSYVWQASGIRRAAFLACQRQKHLVEMSNEELECILKGWKLPQRTLSMLGLADSYACTQTDWEETKQRGQLLGNMPSENSETHHTKQS